jgi:hypothetical protein
VKTYCNNCRFWQHWGGSSGMGFCRAEPPEMNHSQKAIWPVSEGQDWCGRHEPNMATIKRGITPEQAS